MDDVYTVMEWDQCATAQKHRFEKKSEKSTEGALWKALNVKDAVLPLIPEAEYVAFNDFGKPSHHAMAYAVDSSELRYNHPLHIMVGSSFLQLFANS